MSKTTINKALIKQAVLAKLSNLRQSTSHTKTRGQVSGGGRKPWKQKGTGRARAGSSRSPIWSGGGVTFGPSNERNFKLSLPKRMARTAKAQLWQLIFDEKRVQQIDKMKLAEPKTKLAVKLLADLKITGTSTLLITKELEPELIIATANIPKVDVKVLSNVGILDLAKYRNFAMEKSCYEEIYNSDTKKKSTATSHKTSPKSKVAK